MSNVDKLRRAFSILNSLKQNVPQNHEISEKYVIEYHRVLEELQKQGIDIQEFKIEPAQVKPRLISSNSLTGERTYSEGKYIERSFFLMKLDSLLGYFTLTIEDRKPQIGF